MHDVFGIWSIECENRRMSEPIADRLETRESIFLRMKSTDPQPREMAWAEFRRRYAPAIAGFARRLGARAHDIDDIVQDVCVGFFAVSPRFVYDPSKDDSADISRRSPSTRFVADSHSTPASRPFRSRSGVVGPPQDL
jgi:hypothetical protein